MNENSNYPPNSHRSKTDKADIPEKKVEKVVSGNVVRRKKGLGRQVAETFTGEDAQSVGQYILFDVLIPASKSMISDAVSQGVERMLFGDVRRRPNGGARVGTGSGTHVSYNRMSSSSPGRAFEPDGPRRTMSRQARATHNFDEIILESRGEAEEILERLTDLVSQYDVATVTDLYDMIGVTGSFTDEKWGWYDLRSASVSRVRGGYLLDLPKTSPVD